MSENYGSSSAVVHEGSGGVDQVDDGFKDSTSEDLENSRSSFEPTSSSGNNAVLDSDHTSFEEGIVRDFDSSPDRVTIIPISFSNEEESNGIGGFEISENQEFRPLEAHREEIDASQYHSSDVDTMKDGNLGEDAGKEEAFVDAPDHLLGVDGRSSSAGESEKLDIQDSVSGLEVQLHVEEEKNVQQLVDELARLHHELDKIVAEKEFVAHEFEEYKSHPNGGISSNLAIDNEGRELFGRELANLHCQLQLLTNHHSLLEENSDGLVDRLRQAEKEDGDKRGPISNMPLPLLFADFSKLATKLQSALDERMQFEGTIRELHAILFTKDQEIEELNAKVSELVRKGGEPSKSIDSCVELETNCEELRSEVIRESVAQDVVFSYVGSMHKAWSEQEACLKESRRNQLELREQLDQSHTITAKLEEENTKLMEELNRVKGNLEESESERSKLRMDLEQAENKWLGTKEKLSMAVTKGKALVQQRDSLRQSLAEKTNELERCLLELQKKSNDLEAAEAVSLKRFGELEVKLSENQNTIISLQESFSQKNVVLQKIEEIVFEKDASEETKSLQIIDKVGWLVNHSSGLEEELSKRQTLINSLEESLLQKSTFLQNIEETMSRIGTPGELQSMEVFDKVGWLADQRNNLEEELMKSQNLIVSLQESLLQKTTALEKIEEIMVQIGLAEELQSMDIIDRVGWLANRRNSLEGFLLENKNLIVSLQESLLNKTTAFQKIEENLSTVVTFEEMEIVDKIGWLTSERNRLETLVLENQNLFSKLKDSISLINLPEPVLTMELESQINWLGKAFSEAKSDIHRLEDEINHAHDSELSKANKEVIGLETSLLEEKREKDSLQMSFEDLKYKYEAMVEKFSQVSSEKDELVKKLLEVAGEMLDDQPSSDANLILEKSIQNIKEKIISSSLLGTEEVQRTQSLLVEKNEELEQCRKMLEEASSTQARFETSLLEEKREKDSLRMRFEDLECKYEAMIEQSSQVSLEKDELVKKLLEIAGVTLDDLPSSAENLILDKSIQNIKEKIISSSLLGTEEVQRTQSLLVEKNEELEQCRKMLEEASSTQARLETGLLEEKREKDFLRMRFEDLECKYEAMIEQSSQIFLEKDELVKKLLEIAGVTLDDQPSSAANLILEKSIQNIKEKIISSSLLGTEVQRTQSLLVEKNEELEQCRKMLEEASSTHARLETSLLEEKRGKDSLEMSFEDLKCKYEAMVEQSSLVSSEKDELVKKMLEVAGETLDDLPCSDANLILEKSIQNIEEKIISSSLLGTEEVQRVQSLLVERNQELEQCRKMLEEASSTEARHELEIVSLSEEVKRLTEELVFLRDGKDTLRKALEKAEEKISELTEEKDSLQKVLEHAKEKLLMLTEESAVIKDEKDALQKDLERADEKLSLLREKLSMAVKKGKGLVQERENFKHSIDEKNAEIEKLKSELQLCESEIFEFKDQMKSLSGELEHAAKLDSEIIAIRDQKDQVERYLLESNNLLQRAMDSIESIVSPSELVFDDPVEKLNWIREYFYESQTGKSLAEQELQNVREEAGLQARELAGAHATIKSLEDALSQAERNLAMIIDENKETESKMDHELSVLKAELAACMEELVGYRSGLENQNAEIVSQLNQLQMLKNDGAQLLPLLTRSFSKKFEGMRSMGLLLQDIRDQIAQLMNSEWLHENSVPLQISPGRALDEQKDPYNQQLVASPKIEEHLNCALFTNAMRTNDTVDNVTSHLADILEGYTALLRLINDKYEGLSTPMDHQIAVLLQVLRTMKDELVNMSEIMEIFKLKVNNLVANSQTQENTVSLLQKNITILYSACIDATKELQNFGSHQNLLESNSMLERESEEDTVEDQGDNKYIKAGTNLLQVARRFRTQTEQYEKIETARLENLDDLQNQLKEIKFTAENAIRERDLSQNRVSKLEEDLEELRRYCDSMKLKLEDLQTIEVILMEKEAELSSLHHALAAKDQDKGGNILSEAQMGSLFEKVKEIEAAYKYLGTGTMETHLSSFVDKLFYIIDNVIDLQQRFKKTICEKEELQETLAAQDREISNLRNESGRFVSNNQDLEKRNSDLADLKLGLERIIQKLGGYDLSEDKKSASGMGLLAALEKLVTVIILESESSKSKAQEMDAKLHSSQKVMDELTAKVRLLEDSLCDKSALHDKPVPPDTVLERGIFEASSLASGSEISEIEDMGQLGKNPIPTPAAAHVRTMRKGSSDHLALSIDLESDRLINHHESDDKGHIFKSLNTSGLVPKQAKQVADRIDGIWVSGGRILMRRPGARMGLISYWLLLHIWLLASIL